MKVTGSNSTWWRLSWVRATTARETARTRSAIGLQAIDAMLGGGETCIDGARTLREPRVEVCNDLAELVEIDAGGFADFVDGDSVLVVALLDPVDVLAEVVAGNGSGRVLTGSAWSVAVRNCSVAARPPLTDGVVGLSGSEDDRDG